MRGARAKYAVGAALAALSFAVCFFSFNLGHGWGDDFAEYIGQAIALWNGDIAGQIAANGFIIAHTPMGLGPVAYPWGLPLALAPLYGAFGLSLTVFKQVGIVCYALFIFFLFLYYEKRLGGLWAAVLTLLFAVNPVMVSATNVIGSDVPFLLISTLALMAMESLLRGGAPRRQYAMGALTGVLILMAFLFRTNGLVLLLALLCMQAIILPPWKLGRWMVRGGAPCENPRWLAQALPYLIFIPAYLLVNRLLPAGGESHLQYSALISLRSMKNNALYYATLFHRFLAVPVGGRALYFTVTGLFLLGAIRQARRYALPLIYMLGTMALYVVWPSQQGLRFLFPVLPVYILFAALGIKELAAFVARSRARILEYAALWAVLFLCVVMGSSAASLAVQNMERGRADTQGAYARGALAAYQYVQDNTEADAVVAFRRPRVFFLSTHRLSFSPNAEIERLKDADYLLIVSGMPDSSRQVTDLYTPEQIQEKFGFTLEQMHQDANFTLYRIEKAPPGA